jgi:hypothetical protein
MDVHAAVHGRVHHAAERGEAPAALRFSFYGIIDFISIMPTWASFFVPELAFLIDVRLLRLLRVSGSSS